MSDPYHTPRIFHTDAERNYYAWVGMYIATFAAVELSLVCLLDTLYRLFSASDIEPERPIALKRRLALIKKIAKLNIELSTEKTQIDLICTAIKIEADFRHDLIHGHNYERFKILEGNEHYTIMARPESYSGIQPENGTRVTEKLLREKYDQLGGMMFGLIAVNHRLIMITEKKVTAFEEAEDISG